MTEERDRPDTDQILPPSYTAPIGPEDDRGLVDITPDPADRIDEEDEDSDKA